MHSLGAERFAIIGLDIGATATVSKNYQVGDVITERASKGHDSFPQPPDPNVVLWRYMRIDHLCQMLKERKLWMSRSDTLGDPCEGARTGGDRETLDRLAREIRTQHNEEAAAEMRSHWRSMDSRAKSSMFISCWQMAPSDRVSMWKLYCQGGAGAAVRTTYAKLDKALALTYGVEDPLIAGVGYFGLPVMLGVVTYGDYESPEFKTKLENVFSSFMRKKIQYADEEEVRAIVDVHHGGDLKGVKVDIDPEVLVDEIVFSPSVNTDAVDGVTKYIRSIGYSFPTRRSTAFDVPQVYGPETPAPPSKMQIVQAQANRIARITILYMIRNHPGVPHSIGYDPLEDRISIDVGRMPLKLRPEEWALDDAAIERRLAAHAAESLNYDDGSRGTSLQT